MARHHGKHRDTRGPTQRQLRVGEELRHALAQVLARGDLRDPDLQDASTITVTEVRISPDLRNATAFVIPLGGARAPEIVAALRRSAPYLRTQIGKEVPLKFVPTLSFELDQSFDYASRIEALLHRPEVVRDLQASPSDSKAPDGSEAEKPKAGNTTAEEPE